MGSTRVTPGPPRPVAIGKKRQYWDREDQRGLKYDPALGELILDQFLAAAITCQNPTSPFG